MINERGKENGEIEEAKRRGKGTNILERKQKEQGISKKKNERLPNWINIRRELKIKTVR